jgi:ABC-type arginine transport system permease subunit
MHSEFQIIVGLRCPASKDVMYSIMSRALEWHTMIIRSVPILLSILRFHPAFNGSSNMVRIEMCLQSIGKNVTVNAVSARHVLGQELH